MNAISPGHRDLHFRPHSRPPIADDIDRMAEAILSPGGMAWQPDAECLRAGDEYISLALRCWSGSLSDRRIRRRLEHLAELVVDDEHPDIGPSDAAIALARHCAIVGVSPERTVQILARLSIAVPGWEPTDPDEIAGLVRAAYRRVDR
jgi:hypothetical protein